MPGAGTRRDALKTVHSRHPRHAASIRVDPSQSPICARRLCIWPLALWHQGPSRLICKAAIYIRVVYGWNFPTNDSERAACEPSGAQHPSLDGPDQLLSDRGGSDLSERRRKALVRRKFLQVREPPTHDASGLRGCPVE